MSSNIWNFGESRPSRPKTPRNMTNFEQTHSDEYGRKLEVVEDGGSSSSDDEPQTGSLAKLAAADTTEELAKDLFGNVTEVAKSDAALVAPTTNQRTWGRPVHFPGDPGCRETETFQMETGGMYMVVAYFGLLRLGRPAARGRASSSADSQVADDDDFGLAAGCITIPTDNLDQLAITLLAKLKTFQERKKVGGATGGELVDETILVAPQGCRQRGRLPCFSGNHGAAFRHPPSMVSEA